MQAKNPSVWDQPVHVGQSKGWSKTRLVWVYVDRRRRSRSVPSYPFRSGLFLCNSFDVDGTFDEHNYVYDHNDNHSRVPGSWLCPCLASLPSLPPMAPSISSLPSSFRQGDKISDNGLKRVLSHFSVQTILYFFLFRVRSLGLGASSMAARVDWNKILLIKI